MMHVAASRGGDLLSAVTASLQHPSAAHPSLLPPPPPPPLVVMPPIPGGTSRASLRKEL